MRKYQPLLALIMVLTIWLPRQAVGAGPDELGQIYLRMIQAAKSQTTSIKNQDKREQVADDAALKTFEKFKAMPTAEQDAMVKSPSRLIGLTRKIARDMRVDHFRQQQAEKNAMEEVAVLTDTAVNDHSVDKSHNREQEFSESAESRSREREKYADWFAAHPIEHQQTWLFVLMGNSQREIAQKMNVSKSTVQNRSSALKDSFDNTFGSANESRQTVVQFHGLEYDAKAKNFRFGSSNQYSSLLDGLDSAGKSDEHPRPWATNGSFAAYGTGREFKHQYTSTPDYGTKIYSNQSHSSSSWTYPSAESYSSTPSYSMTTPSYHSYSTFDHQYRSETHTGSGSPSGGGGGLGLGLGGLGAGALRGRRKQY